LQLATLARAASRFVKNAGEVKFALIQVTTRCNARCVDRCDIWALRPIDMKLDDLTFAIDVLAKNGFSIIYFTGGETGLYPHLTEAVEYAKKKGMITSITTNGTIPEASLKRLRKSLDVLSVSVDHYDEGLWDNAKCIQGISKKAKETIRTAKAYGIKLYAITFLNPAWTVKDAEQIIRYVNEELGVSFALSYPYTSSNNGTFVVGGTLHGSLSKTQRNIRNMVAKVLQMKLLGSDVVTASCYLRDVLRAHDGLSVRYPCKAGETIITIDCNLNVFPCYKREKLFNLRERQDLDVSAPDNSACDNMQCLINCFKEASLASRETFFRAVKEELVSNPKFYVKLLGYNRS
jgi:MoaA/NifB/PqqE/SkfB family radical SAM enzyme